MHLVCCMVCGATLQYRAWGYKDVAEHCSMLGKGAAGKLSVSWVLTALCCSPLAVLLTGHVTAHSIHGLSCIGSITTIGCHDSCWLCYS